MHADKQRIAIAEACRSIVFTSTDYECGFEIVIESCGKAFDPITDLNAMHEAEKVLTLAQRSVYAAMLASRFNDEPLGDSQEAIEDAGNELCKWSAYAIYLGATSTAAQRAEAFLRTLDKWEGA